MYLTESLEATFTENWARDYNSSIGRFISEDPLQFDGGDENLYRSVHNRVTLLIDPYGMCSDDPINKLLKGQFGGGGPGKPPANFSRPTGRRGNPIKVPPTNKPGTIYGRTYTGHALDQMQGRGIPPSAVENAIKTGTGVPGNRPGTFIYKSGDLKVIVNQNGHVITVIPQ